MNKYLLLLILPLLSLTLTGCNDEDDIKPLDLNLISGTWEVVNQGEQNVFHREEILHISSSMINGSYGGYQGYITTYYLKYDNTVIHERTFSWSIREVENHQPLLDIVFVGHPDNEDIWDGNYYYKITKLTDTHMWWQVNTNGDNSIIKFQRRSDIPIE